MRHSRGLGAAPPGDGAAHLPVEEIDERRARRGLPGPSLVEVAQERRARAGPGSARARGRSPPLRRGRGRSGRGRRTR